MLSSLNTILNIHPDYFQHLCPACYEKATRDVMETRSLYSHMEREGAEATKGSAMGPPVPCPRWAQRGAAPAHRGLSRQRVTERAARQECARELGGWDGMGLGPRKATSRVVAGVIQRGSVEAAFCSCKAEDILDPSCRERRRSLLGSPHPAVQQTERGSEMGSAPWCVDTAVRKARCWGERRLCSGLSGSGAGSGHPREAAVLCTAPSRPPRGKLPEQERVTRPSIPSLTTSRTRLSGLATVWFWVDFSFCFR